MKPPELLVMTNEQSAEMVNLLTESGVIGTALQSHLTRANADWEPYKYGPYGIKSKSYKDYPYDSSDSIYPPAVQAALRINILTEDNLPYYFNELFLQNLGLPPDHPLPIFTGRWTLEEWKHGVAIREWAQATRALNPQTLEEGRVVQMGKGIVPHGPNLIETFVYTSFQELATYEAHSNTMEVLSAAEFDPKAPDAEQIIAGKKLGKNILGLVSADETAHCKFYLQMIVTCLEINPSLTMVAIARQLREFSMPGTGIPSFEEDSKLIARSGIFGMNELLNVFKQVLAAWNLDSNDIMSRLDPAGENAYEQIQRVISVYEFKAKKETVAREGSGLFIPRATLKLPSLAGTKKYKLLDTGKQTE